MPGAGEVLIEFEGGCEETARSRDAAVSLFASGLGGGAGAMLPSVGDAVSAFDPGGDETASLPGVSGAFFASGTGAAKAIGGGVLVAFDRGCDELFSAVAATLFASAGGKGELMPVFGVGGTGVASGTVEVARFFGDVRLLVVSGASNGAVAVLAGSGEVMFRVGGGEAAMLSDFGGVAFGTFGADRSPGVDNANVVFCSCLGLEGVGGASDCCAGSDAGGRPADVASATFSVLVVTPPGWRNSDLKSVALAITITPAATSPMRTPTTESAKGSNRPHTELKTPLERMTT